MKSELLIRLYKDGLCHAGWTTRGASSCGNDGLINDTPLPRGMQIVLALSAWNEGKYYLWVRDSSTGCVYVPELMAVALSKESPERALEVYEQRKEEGL